MTHGPSGQGRGPDGLPPKQPGPDQDSCPYDGVVFRDANAYADYLMHRQSGVCPKCRRRKDEKIER